MNYNNQRNDTFADLTGNSNLSSHRANIYSNRKLAGESYLSDAIKTSLITEEG